MCQQILQFCSGSAKPLLFAGGLLSLLMAVAIGYTGCTTNALYRDIDPQIADTRSLGYHLQLAAAAYLTLVTALSCYAAYYDHKHATRALAGVTTLNFVLALAAILMVPSGQELSQPFQETLEQAAKKYNFSDMNPQEAQDSSSLSITNLTASPRKSSSISNGEGAAANETKERQVRSANELREISAENATKIWDNLQRRGCCGITNATRDWKDGKIPKSCCSDPFNDHEQSYCKEADSIHQRGCLALIGSTRLNLLIVLALIALVNFYLATISGISAYKTYSYSEASQNAYT